jgi:hypothetical protein
MKRKTASPNIRTIAQARAFVRKEGLVGIFSNNEGAMASLWDVVDLPGRQPGQKGWGQKVTAIWTWKNELPARWPEEVFYGKIPGGLAVLMSIERLKAHYPENHVPLKECSPVAQKIAAVLRFDPATTPELRRTLGMTLKPEKARFDRALQELQTTLNIARRNSLEDKNDTWVPFREQYLDIVLANEK